MGWHRGKSSPFSSIIDIYINGTFLQQQTHHNLGRHSIKITPETGVRLPSSVTLVIVCFLPFHPDQMVLLVTPPPTSQSCWQYPGFQWKSVCLPSQGISLLCPVRQHQQLAQSFSWIQPTQFSCCPSVFLLTAAAYQSHKPVCPLPQNPPPALSQSSEQRRHQLSGS